MIVAVYVLTTVLHVIIPARVVLGYCCDNQTMQRLEYRLNGFVVLIVTVAIFLRLPSAAAQVLYLDYYNALITANIIGLVVSVAYFAVGGTEKYPRCVTIDQATSGVTLQPSLEYAIVKATGVSNVPPLTRFFLGHQWNPRILWGTCDVKMLLYLLGAVGLACIVMSTIAVHVAARQDGSLSLGMQAYGFCMFWFIAEYLLGEEGATVNNRTITQTLIISPYYLLLFFFFSFFFFCFSPFCPSLEFSSSSNSNPSSLHFPFSPSLHV